MKDFVTKVLILSLFLVSDIALSQNESDSLFLSNLNVSAEDPLYTTYAAHMERSEFALDEGYHFSFYKKDEPVSFSTDNAGKLFLVFKKDGEVVYKPVDMSRKPVITTSYTDMVTYNFYPFENIRVDATFQVYSSHQALMDVEVKNQTESRADIKIYAALLNDYRTFDQIQYKPKANAVTFHHQELPDGWVTRNEVPYVSDVQDVLLFSEPADSMNSYHTFGEEKFSVPSEIDLHKTEMNLVEGEVKHKDGSECNHTSPESGMIAYVNDNPEHLITHKAPRWGRIGNNVSGNGSYDLELGNLTKQEEGDTYTVRYYCSETNQTGRVEGEFSDFEQDSVLEKNLKLSSDSEVGAPTGLSTKSSASGEKLVLDWKAPDSNSELTYYVYRRNYPGSGVYEKIAEVGGSTNYQDSSVDLKNVYGYIVVGVNEAGKMSKPTKESLQAPQSSFIGHLENKSPQKSNVEDLATTVTLSHSVSLESGGSESVRLVRGVSRPDKPDNKLIDEARRMLTVDLEGQVAFNQSLYSDIPRIDFNDRQTNLLYWSSYNMMRQVMLPPEGQLNHNNYVYSREPTWGWGHAGQVFHESLTMLAYGYMDPESAMESQRVYEQVQYDNGYIYYRTGSFFNAKNPVNGQLTTSAPWYAWQNWMLYKMTQDREFLEDMYASSKKFYEYYTSNRDSDGDGLLEWGGHAVLESVRDALVAVWRDVDWPTNFEGVDVNSMVVVEEKALAKMAEELGKDEEAEEFREAAKKRSQLINKYMWDEKTGFYYNVDKGDHDFTYDEKNDLKRKEIIGFLPLWAGVASEEQAERLVDEHLTNPDEFWRKYGVPSLSADDPFYNPQGYWNGPVWVEWNYLIEHGLLKYGYEEEAKEVVDRVAANMINRLVEDHNLWEFYSPDSSWGGHHKTYVWAGIINRMLMDVYADSK